MAGSVARCRVSGRRAVADKRILRPDPHPDSATGWVYIVANNFDRSAPVRLFRVPPGEFTDRARWQGWSARPDGGQPADAALGGPGGGDELQADRRQGGAVVLQRQHRQHGDPRGRPPDRAGRRARHHRGRADAWPDPAESLPSRDDNKLAQPYGGYISPVSTLEEVRVFVSQWNTAIPGPRPVPGHPVRGQPVQALVRALIPKTPGGTVAAEGKRNRRQKSGPRFSRLGLIGLLSIHFDSG